MNFDMGQTLSIHFSGLNGILAVVAGGVCGAFGGLGPWIKDDKDMKQAWAYTFVLA